MELHSPQRIERVLPAQDRGYAAWSFLLAAAVVECVIWRIPFSFGIIMEHYLQLPEIASQPNASTLIPLIGSLASGIIYCSAPLVYPYMLQHPSHIRPLMWLGMILCCTSLLIASYCQKVYEYVIFQGVLYGIGGGLIYPPRILFMTEWFLKRRSLANGVIFASTTVGSLIMPFIVSSLVHAFGLFSTLRIIATAAFVLLLPCLIFVRPRVPHQLRDRPGQTIKESAITLRNRMWWTLVSMNIVQALAFFVPLIYIPLFSSALHLDSTLSALAMALLNGSSSASPLFVGFLSGYFTPWPIAFILSFLPLVSTIVFWGATGDVVGVMLFGATYGFIAGGWSTLWPSFVPRISRGNSSLSTPLLNLLLCTRGLGNILSAPISTALAPVKTLTVTSGGSKRGFALDGGRFVPLIAYIGACFAAATLISVVGWYWDKVVADSDQEPARVSD